MTKVKFILSLLLANVSLLIAFSAFTPSRLVYVGLCSKNAIVVNPGESINAALNTAKEGDTIIVKSGNYYESNITINKRVTIVGEYAETTVIDGKSMDQSIFHIIASHVIIKNFTIQNTSLTGPFPAPAVKLYNVQNVSVQNVITRNVYYGVEVHSSNFTKIAYNMFHGRSNGGIYIHDKSYNNTIFGNTFINNSIAIRVADSTCKFNKICYNNFINNTQIREFQVENNGDKTVFDDGYPFGGNYWNNHVAQDLFFGPDQKEVGSDGILDKAYPDPFSMWDRYPLAYPIANIEVAADGNRFMIHVSTNSTIINYIFNQSAGSLTLFINGPADTNGSCRVAVPKELLVAQSLDNWTITFYDGNEKKVTPQLVLDDEENTYLYFTYSHSITRVEMVVAEHTNLLILMLSALALIPITIKKRQKLKRK